MSDELIKIAKAMYSKEKESKDKQAATDVQKWTDQCRINGILSSTIFLNGVWEREEERAHRLCRYFWETLIDLVLRQNQSLKVEEQDQIRKSARETIDNELGQAKATIQDCVRLNMPDKQSPYDQKILQAKENFGQDFERELSIRAGLAAIEKSKSTAAELPTSVIVGMEFSFVTDNELRKICKRDHEEVQRVQIAGAHKATILLSGSLTEALLLNALQRDEAKAKSSSKAPSGPLAKWDLHDLLEVAVDLGLINPGAAVLAKGIKDYRNLIHPGKEIRTKFHVGSEEAAISRQFLELVIRDLTTKS